MMLGRRLIQETERLGGPGSVPRLLRLRRGRGVISMESELTARGSMPRVRLAGLEGIYVPSRRGCPGVQHLSDSLTQ